MSVFLNEAAIRTLLEAPAGPVARDVQRRAESMLDAYRERVSEITFNMPFSVAQDVEKVTFGDGSVEVGIFNNGSVARYLAEKIPRESDKILPQLEAAFLFPTSRI